MWPAYIYNVSQTLLRQDIAAFFDGYDLPEDEIRWGVRLGQAAFPSMHIAITCAWQARVAPPDHHEQAEAF
jgi:hypothetical protein